MKRIIIILIVVAVGGYFTYAYFQGKAEEKAKQIAQIEKKREARNASVAQMVSKYSAADDWMDKLHKGSTGEQTKILTMELENVWLINRPILFKGTIKDISTLDANNYLMTIEYDMSLKERKKFSTELALTLNSPKNMIDSFLRINPNASSGISSVAVIAKINKIETKYRKTEEGDEEEVRTGIGQCIDILLYNELFLEDLF